MIIALYPGSFDPVTNGHIDIATRASKLFDKIIVGIFATPEKNLMFSLDERVDMARRALGHLPKIEVKPYSNITVEFAREVNADVLVRGLRMIGDFEWEFEMAMMNQMLSPGLETVCFMASQEYQFLSASLIKEVASLGGDISKLVPRHVAEALKKKGIAKIRK
ncbi:MAG: pantetheine-phosphate adenylyltransferase [Chloroflexi bacterium RBG_16_56_11]|nr:MAG: pantetheine-phosphate adenylyltransferase [Chloroflexi bacterium RBG_16_56_11]